MAASGVTMTIYANVTQIGSWNITTVANNGITFSGSGTFTTTGCQPITLTASGTPTSAGTVTAVTNTTPTGTATATVAAPATNPSTNGGAIVANYGNSFCSIPSSGTINGTLTQGVAASGVTMTLYANVTQIGTWSISTVANNGITFSGSGTFTTTGCQPITLTAAGTPTAAGPLTITTNTTPAGTASTNVAAPNSATTNGTGVVAAYGGTGCTGNGIINGTYTVGQALTSANTLTFYANVTQVGSWNISTTTNNGVTFNGNGTFTSTGCQPITLNGSGTPTTAGTLIVSTNTTPSGTAAAVVNPASNPSTNGGAIVAAYGGAGCTGNGIVNGTYTVGQALTSANTLTFYANVTQIGSYNISTIANNGVTFSGSGNFTTTGCQAITLTGAGTPIAAGSLIAVTNTTPSGSAAGTVNAATSPSTNGTAVVSNYGNSSCANPSSGTINGTLTQGEAVSGVTMTLYANVTQIGTWSLSAAQNGVTFSGSGTFTTTGCQPITLTATGTPSAAGAFTWATNSTPQGSSTATVAAASVPLPANITLAAVNPYFIASVYDQDYTPYTAPTSAASLATSVAAGGGNEPTIVNVQGTLTTTGVTINIPYTVSADSVSLPAFSKTITIPANYTEDGISRDVTFSYPANTYPAGTGNITATLKAVGGTLNVKKLDIQTGIGNDNLGFLLGQFTFATNSTGGTANFQVRDIAGIPDRNIADANHVMLYLPVTAKDGKVWLNNNLGADYSNTAKSSFNLAQQATAIGDYKAYGSLYQWGRPSDGHELVNWLSSTTSNFTGTTATKSTTDVPGNALFITGQDWRSTQNDNLWQGENGVNNPCPFGFRLPTNPELTALWAAEGITNYTTAVNSSLKFPITGYRNLAEGFINSPNDALYLWSSTANGTNVDVRRIINTVTTSTNPYNRSYGFPVRCIQNNWVPPWCRLNRAARRSKTP